MKKCTLCGGNLDQNKRCTFCGLDNTKNDDMYKHLINQNACADEPLTHVHTEPAKTHKTIYTTRTRKTTNSSSKSGLAKVIGVIAVVITLASSVFELVEDFIADESIYSNYEEVEHNPYEYVAYDLPEEGMEYSVTLEPGIYTVGVHIPEGTYEANVVSGNYGMIEIHDYNNSIYLYENIGLEDEATTVADLRLYQGGHFVVNTGIVVTLSSTNVQSLELFTKANELTENVNVQGTMVAGEDFPAGVYDILYTPSADGGYEYGIVEYHVPRDNYEYEWSVGFGDTGQSEKYHNVVLTKGTVVISNELENITLIPSEQIITTDINDFYETF